MALVTTIGMRFSQVCKQSAILTIDMFRRSNSQNAVNLVAAGVAVANGDGGPLAVCSDGGPHHR